MGEEREAFKTRTGEDADVEGHSFSGRRARGESETSDEQSPEAQPQRGEEDGPDVEGHSFGRER